MKELIAMIEGSTTFNGHNQLTISPITNKRLLKLFKKLQDHYDDREFWLELRYCYSAHMDSQLSASIYKNYNDRDVLLCTFDKVIGTKIFQDSGE